MKVGFITYLFYYRKVSGGFGKSAVYWIGVLGAALAGI